MIFSRLTSLGFPRYRLLASQATVKSSSKNGGIVKWLWISSISIFTICCVLQNPDLYVPIYDKVPRDDFYFNKHYFAAVKSNRMHIVPPVRMHHDGVLEFPYEDEENYENPCKK
ncbi:unnamed protein product [Heterobilharzia americana]|nr:unnamed protein product [Heterobilharzia americana]